LILYQCFPIVEKPFSVGFVPHNAMGFPSQAEREGFVSEGVFDLVNTLQLGAGNWRKKQTCLTK
jgi:hypothetical protein